MQCDIWVRKLQSSSLLVGHRNRSLQYLSVLTGVGTDLDKGARAWEVTGGTLKKID